MYFAVEAPHPDLPDQLTRALKDLCSTKGDKAQHVFALIDGVFDEQLLNKRPWNRHEKYSLYEGTDLQELGAAAPHLLVAPDDPDEREHWLRAILTACDGKPMLSFLASALPAPELRHHLRPYLVARTEDLTEWPIRWGDTRALPEILSLLEAECHAHLMSPLYVWWSIRRDGSLSAWTGSAMPDPSPADFEKMPLSDEAFSTLVDRAEADAVLASIHDTHAHLVKRYKPSECHSRVAKHLLIADESGIQTASARQHFGMLALSLKDSFLRHPEMATLLRRTQQGSDYAAEIRGLPENFWKEMG